jgi:octanoyl-[GcvH]:protein N-octanoyltransferase
MIRDDFAWTDRMSLLDRTGARPGDDIRASFAIDELLARQVGEGAPPVCHLWRHSRAFVLGPRDGRLPRAAEAVGALQREGYDVLVRHSGGAAVPLDEGIVNVSLILPLDSASQLGFHGDFERMYALIRASLGDLGAFVGKGEVAGSYCPGDYDLHVDGLKFCGISQRRQVRAMIVQAFVIVEGSGISRAERVKAFYDTAGDGAEPSAYPLVMPGTMTSLVDSRIAYPGGAETFAVQLAGTLVRLQAEHGFARGTLDPSLPDKQAIADMRERLSARYPIPSLE